MPLNFLFYITYVLTNILTFVNFIILSFWSKCTKIRRRINNKKKNKFCMLNIQNFLYTFSFDAVTGQHSRRQQKNLIEFIFFLLLSYDGLDSSLLIFDLNGNYFFLKLLYWYIKRSSKSVELV